MEVEVVKMTPEIQFAQHLAANNPKTRYRALKKLAKWFRSRGQGKPFSCEDLMTIWKGLFYCMWMSDKPLVQEKLADHLCDLIHCFGQSETVFMFIGVFFQTMAREWYGIDKFRIEKFMMLVRRFLRQSFHHLKKQKWSVKSIRALLRVLSESVLSPNCDKTPAGLKMHVADIYLEELATVGGTDFKTKKLLAFLRPYCRVMAETKDATILVAVSKHVFTELVESLEEPLFPFKIKHDLVADLLVQSASGEEVRTENRSTMYGLVGTFRDAARGVLPSDKVDMEVEFGRVITKKIVDDAAKRLLEDKEKVKRDREKWLKSRKRKKKVRGSDDINPNLIEISEVNPGYENLDGIAYMRSDRVNSKMPGLKGESENFQVSTGSKFKKNEKCLKGSKENIGLENHVEKRTKLTSKPAISPAKKSNKNFEKKQASDIETNVKLLSDSTSSALPADKSSKNLENKKNAKVVASKRNWSQVENIPESDEPKSTVETDLKKLAETPCLSLHKQSKLPKFIVTPHTTKKAKRTTGILFSPFAKFVVTPCSVFNKPQIPENTTKTKHSRRTQEACSTPGNRHPLKKAKIPPKMENVHEKNVATSTKSLPVVNFQAPVSQKVERANERMSAKSVYDLHNKALQSEISASDDTPHNDVLNSKVSAQAYNDALKSNISAETNVIDSVRSFGKQVNAPVNDSQPIINIHTSTRDVMWNGSAHPKGSFDSSHKRRVSFATFEHFVKTPPCFFRKSVSKVKTPLSGILKKPNVMRTV